MAAVPINIFTPYFRHLLLIVALGGLGFYGLANYVSAFLGAGIPYVHGPGSRAWCTAAAGTGNW